MPRHNNHIESLNRQLRDLFRNHQGMTRMHRIKATFWWCYMHTECPLSAEQLLKTMPPDKDQDFLRQLYGSKPKTNEPVEWDNGVVWNEFHYSTRYPFSID